MKADSQVSAQPQAVSHHLDNSNVLPMPGRAGFAGLLDTGGPFSAEMSANAALMVLEQLSQPVLMFDRDLTIRYKNDAADTLLQSGAGLESRAGRLFCAREAEQQALVSMCENLRWDQLVDSISPQHTQEQRAVRIGTGTPRHGMVLLSRLITLPMQSPVGPAQLGLLQVHENRRRGDGLSPHILRMAYKLTRAESAVAMLIADGYAPSEIAESRRVSVETIRAQLRVLYAKTGTKRQAELVRLVHCLSALT